MDSMLTLNNTTLGPVLSLVLALAQLIGVVMAGIGIKQMATAGQNRGQYSHGAGMGFTLLLCGSLLTSVGGTGAFVSVVMASFYGDNVSPEMAIATVQATDGSRAILWMKVVFNILIIIGWISVIRGLMILGIAGSKREKGLGAGITHIIAGMLLTNPTAFASMVGYTIGQQEVVQLILPR